MKSVQILYAGAPSTVSSVLRQRCASILFPLSSETLEVIDRLKYAIVRSTQRHEDKVWTKRALAISAPQIGAPVKMFVCSQDANVGTFHQYRGYQTIINPSVTWRSKDLIKDWEGCLSVPDKQAYVARHYSVSVQYWTPEGQRKERRLTELMAKASVT